MGVNGFKKLLEEAPKYSWLETGTAVFSFFNIVAISICAPVSAGFLFFLTQRHFLVQDVSPDLWYLCISCCIGTVLAFVFAALLYLGMYQKRPSFVLAYFIFGVVLDLSMVYLLMFVKHCHETRDTWQELQRYSALQYVYVHIIRSYSMIAGVGVVYSGVLVMVCHTYFWLRNNRSYHQRLLDDKEESSPISAVEKYEQFVNNKYN